MAIRKFVHEESYRGADLLKKLASKQIVLCGAGALGSNLADLFCRQGISMLRVIDFDRVESHNVNTQLYGDQDVGQLKVAALKNRLFNDAGVDIETIDKELKSSTLRKSFKDADLVIDSFDNTSSRRLVSDYCKAEGIDCLHGGMFEDYGEIVWNEVYTVPQEVPGARDICEYPLARNLVLFVVTGMAEETMNFLTAAKPRRASWSITLKDLSIRPYR
jgi:molybdopterin/thiamine biosynthesis adenylyltransferase